MKQKISKIRQNEHDATTTSEQSCAVAEFCNLISANVVVLHRMFRHVIHAAVASGVVFVQCSHTKPDEIMSDTYRETFVEQVLC